MSIINNTNSANNNFVAISCPSCGSNEFRKNGTSKTARQFLCKNCRRSFSVRWDNLEGTPYARSSSNNDVVTINNPTNTETSSSIPSVNEEAINARRSNIIDTTNNTSEETIIDFEDKNVNLILARAKKDEDGNFLLKIGSSAPVPIGSSTEELRNIINQNGGCRMAMTENGIFVIKIAPTTKG